MSTSDSLIRRSPVNSEARQDSALIIESGEPVGILDLGSNSIRFVIFEHLSRAPATMFNEKILCGLGRDLPRTGRLHGDGIKRALGALKRFHEIALELQVKHIWAIATAAVREAEDGAEFLRQVEDASEFHFNIISGEREAELAALGLISAIPDADGIVADLGGGSLEVAEVQQSETGTLSSLPLGPFRLMALGPIRRHKTRKLVDQALEEETWLHAHKGKDLYLIGGAWRAIAKAHMEKLDHPMKIVQQYSLSPREAERLCADFIRLDLDEIDHHYDVSLWRLPSLPYAALALSRLLKYVRPGRVVFCAHGIREGLLFDLLTEDLQKHDPLIEMAREMSTVGRRQANGEVLFSWMAPLFADENDAERRLRFVACLLSDIGWRTHPDYRAEKVLIDIMRAPFVAIEHQERALLALAVYFRHQSRVRGKDADSAREMLKPGEFMLAQKIGYALQLGRVLTGGITDLVKETDLSVDANSLILRLPQNDAFGTPDQIKEALARIGQVTKRTPEVEVLQTT